MAPQHHCWHDSAESVCTFIAGSGGCENNGALKISRLARAVFLPGATRTLVAVAAFASAVAAFASAVVAFARAAGDSAVAVFSSAEHDSLGPEYGRFGVAYGRCGSEHDRFGARLLRLPGATTHVGRALVIRAGSSRDSSHSRPVQLRRVLQAQLTCRAGSR